MDKPESAYDSLGNIDKLLMQAMAQEAPELFKKDGKTAEALRDEYAEAYLTDPSDLTNPFVRFFPAISGHIRYPGQKAPLPPEPRLHLTHKELDALKEKLEKDGLEAIKELVMHFNDPVQNDQPKPIKFMEYNAAAAADILLPLAIRMDADAKNTDAAFVRAATTILLGNEHEGHDAMLEEAYKKYGLKPPVEPARLDKKPIDLVLELLEKKHGVFIGQEHSDRYSSDFIIAHAKDLKRENALFFLEINHELVADLRAGREKAPDSPVWKNKHDMTNWRNMVLALDEAGIEVIGYDSLELKTKSGHPGYDAIMPAYMTSFSGVTARNEDGEKNIKAALEKMGNRKFIVFGGYSHSGDVKEGEFTDLTGNQGREYRGLNARLGIPSIIFNSLEVEDGVYRDDRRYSDYFISHSKGAHLLDKLPPQFPAKDNPETPVAPPPVPVMPVGPLGSPILHF